MVPVHVSAMDVLGKLCVREDNDEVVEMAIETQAYESLVRILIIPDVQVNIISTNVTAFDCKQPPAYSDKDKATV